MKPLNILYIESSILPSRGGVQRVSWVIAEYLKKQGHDVYFAYYLVGCDEVDDKHKFRIDIHAKKSVVRDELCRYIVNNQIDVVINQGLCWKVLIDACVQARSIRPLRMIYCYHGHPGLAKYERKPRKERLKAALHKMLYGDMMQKMYSEAAAVVLLSPSFIKDFAWVMKLANTDRIHAISNPLSFPSVISAEKISAKKQQVLIISRLEEQVKNIRSALRIWQRIEELGAGEWELILGGYGSDEQMLLDYARELGLRSFRFVGKVETPQQWYSSASLFMMTSHSEGFGMTLTEAMQCGCVPLAFDSVSVFHEIISDGCNGFLIPPGDEQRYAEKMLELMHSPATLASLAAQAVESSGRFSVETIGDQWINLFEKLNSPLHV